MPAIGQTADRRDVEDGAAPLLHRLAPCLLCPHERPADVHLERLVVPGEVDVDRRAHIGVGGGVVDEDVQPAEAFDGGSHAGLGLVGFAGVGGVDGDVAVDAGGRLLEGLLLAGREHHLGA